jgi:hypothetical protein
MARVKKKKGDLKPPPPPPASAAASVGATSHRSRFRTIGIRLRAISQRLRAMPCRWDLAAALAFALVSLLIYAQNPTSQRPGSDGHYSWIYARSLAYDGDLDFTNDYGLCGDPLGIGWTTQTHHRANMFYMGPAVFWTPAIWLLKHFVSGEPKVAGGCVGPISALVLSLSSIAGAIVVFVTSALLRRWVGPRTAALAALLATLGGHAIYFTAMTPSYSHIYDAMCVALYVYVVVRIREEGATPVRLAAAGALLGLAILQRSSNVVFFLVAVGALFRPKPRAALGRSALSLLLVGYWALLWGVAPLLVANKVIFGRLILYAHGPHFLWPGHAHPWLLLFDERGGLFDAAPVMWLAVPGLAMLLRKPDARWFAVPLLLCCAFELYLSSAAMDWQGARRLLNLTPLGALCIALTVERAGRFLRARDGRLPLFAGATMVAAVAWANGTVAFGFARGKLPWDQPLTSSERYGEAQKQAVAAIENDVGSLAVLPAAWVFSLRYHLKPISFGLAAHPKWFQRDSYSLAYFRDDFSFTEPETRPLLRGVRVDEAAPGACMVGSRATAVFSLQWPVVTRVRLLYDATAEDTLSVRTRSFSGIETPWDARVPLAAGTQRNVVLRVPPHGLDSGINELELERGGEHASLCLHALEFVDDTRYPAAPEAEASSPIHMWRAGVYGEGGAEAPSVAVGRTAGDDWMVEVHETPARQLAYDAGRIGAFASPVVLGAEGFRPRVAADYSRVIEVHQGQPGGGDLWCRTGQIAVVDAKVTMSWDAPLAYGSGYHPAVAAVAGQVIEVDMADPSGSALTLRTGHHGSGTVIWNASRSLGTPGHNPALAAASSEGDRDALVVEAHQKDAALGGMWLRVGRLHADGSITWKDPEEYDRGMFPSLAVFRTTIVEVHQGQESNGPLFVKIGTVGDDGVVSWVSTRKYDDGGHPVLALDGAAHKGLEAHEAAEGAARLWGRDIDLY